LPAGWLELVFSGFGKYSFYVKILIEIATVQYDRLLSMVPADAPAYSILKNGVVIDPSKPSIPHKTVHILCEVEEARELLAVAKQLCPEAAPQIEDGLVNPRPFEP
jgi:hypothetical protein